MRAHTFAFRFTFTSATLVDAEGEEASLLRALDKRRLRKPTRLPSLVELSSLPFDWVFDWVFEAVLAPQPLLALLLFGLALLLREAGSGRADSDSASEDDPNSKTIFRGIPLCFLLFFLSFLQKCQQLCRQ